MELKFPPDSKTGSPGPGLFPLSFSGPGLPQDRPALPFLPDGAIFDMDGLMLDTERLEIGLYVKVSREMGWPTKEEVLHSTVGIRDEDAEIFYKETYGAAYPFREIWAAVRKEEETGAEKNGLPHRPGLLVLLDTFARLGVPLAAATSTERARALWKLERGGIAERFTALACGDEVHRGKPAPDIFLLAAERLGVKPRNCAGFEDSPAGLAGLAAAGIPSVFVKDLASPPPEILRTVWQSCTDLAEAAKLFGFPKA